ncbi:MAG: preprotein translocase subunit YajC [Gammaproteobacteria bacterium]|nr:preprotein translocase subunit YajC [Gammaproteobacteria bacterium]
MKSKFALITMGILGVGMAFAAEPAAVLNLGTSVPAAAVPSPSSLPSLAMLVVFVLIFYFLLIRPQMKRAKEQRQVMSSLEKGDEVITSSGLYGKIINVDSSIVEVEVADKVILKMQKQAIVSLVPKGTVGIEAP